MVGPAASVMARTAASLAAGFSEEGGSAGLWVTEAAFLVAAGGLAEAADEVVVVTSHQEVLVGVGAMAVEDLGGLGGTAATVPARSVVAFAELVPGEELAAGGGGQRWRYGSWQLCDRHRRRRNAQSARNVVGERRLV